MYQSDITRPQQLLGQQVGGLAQSLGAPEPSSVPAESSVAPETTPAVSEPEVESNPEPTPIPVTNDVTPPPVAADPEPTPAVAAPEPVAGSLTGALGSAEAISPPLPPAKSEVASPSPTGPSRPRLGRLRIVLILLVGLLIIAMLAPIAYLGFANLRSKSGSANNKVNGDYTVTTIPLNDLVKSGDISFDASRRVNINGQLKINNSFVLTPSDTPDNPLIGQFYLNNQNTTLYYYNGNSFVDLVTGTQLAQLTTTVNQTQAIANQAASQTITLPQDLAVTATPTFAGLNLSQPLPIASGGTGATTAAGALTNLGAAASGANSDITSLNALTAISPTTGVTYQFAPAVAGTYDLCSTAGNCAGVGGGVTTIGGTPGRIAKFSAAQGIVDSLLSESGSTVTANGDLAVTGGDLDLGNGVNLDSAVADSLHVDASLNVEGTITSFLQIYSSESIVARNGSSNKVRIGNVGPSNEAGITFSSLEDVSIYRSTAGTLKTNGNFIVQPGTNSTTAFQVQNAAGTSNLLVADTTNTRIGIGTAGPNYTLDVDGDINTGSTYRINGTSICILSGCVPSSGSSAYIQNGTVPQDANYYLRSAAANQITGILQGAVGQTADLIQLRNQAGGIVTSVGADGNATFTTTSNSATAFQIQNSSGQNLLVADTSNQRLAIGPAASPANSVLTVGSNTTAASGGITFGTDTNLYRSAANRLKTDDSLQVTGAGAFGSSATIHDIGAIRSTISASETYSDASAASYITGIDNELHLNSDANATTTITGIGNSVFLNGSGSYSNSAVSSQNILYNYSTSASALTGVDNRVVNEGDVGTAIGGYNVYSTSYGTTNLAQGLVSQILATSEANITSATGVSAGISNLGTGTINNGYGLLVTTAVNSGGGVFQNNYGMYIQDQSGVGSTNSYNLYSAGVNAKNYIAGLLQVGTTSTPTQAGTNLLASNVEIGGALRVGDATNNVQFDGTTKKLIYNGTARQNVRVSMNPEYQGAVLTGDGSNNTGTMTTDFCSGSSRLSINTSVCGATDEYNYYSWIGSGGTTDYDVYVRWQVPSNFSAFKDANAINLRGWRSTSSEKVELAMFQQNGTQCGSTTEVNSSNTTWQSTNMTGDETACSVSADDVITFRIRLTASSSGYARAGLLEINYLSKF
ncbi:hypothetical protein EPO04_03925 [Patescibacteria group bacterium]|nr:MAG: hypothetical protein EPO04_03925 [Patescibacteria group bacterium]